jgi:hypothetical protein
MRFKRRCLHSSTPQIAAIIGERNNSNLPIHLIYDGFCYLSHLIAVPPGVSPANAIMSSPLMMGEFGGGMGMDIGGGAQGGAGGAGAGGGQFAEYGGVDPALDPELAMVLRASAEEARAHEAALVRFVRCLLS